MSNNDDVVRRMLNGGHKDPTSDFIDRMQRGAGQMPAQPLAPLPPQVGQQQIPPHVQAALQNAAQACEAACSTMPGFRFAAVFKQPGAQGQIIIAALPIGEIFASLVDEMKRANVPIPPIPGVTQGDSTHTLHNVALVAAIRRALPFITGPGSETARKLLVEATQPLNDDGPEQTVARVVADLLMTLPGIDRPDDRRDRRRDAEEVGQMLIDALHGALRLRLVVTTDRPYN